MDYSESVIQAGKMVASHVVTELTNAVKTLVIDGDDKAVKVEEIECKESEHSKITRFRIDWGKAWASVHLYERKGS